MNILLIPRVEINKERNETNYILDIRLYKFLNYCFKTKNVFINDINLKDNIKIDLIVISGGNNLINKKKSDVLRYKISKKIIEFGLKKKIPILGICYGAQLISSIYDSKIKKVMGHVRSKHFVFSANKKRLVNSYHNYAIHSYNSKKLKPLMFDSNNNIEMFNIINKKIIGIMWHPERNQLYDYKDIKIIRDLCN